ncbi:MAG: histidine kinase [Flavobacteriales bacterium]|nr:histidine kinase [Flavobacteriales bacterium]
MLRFFRVVWNSSFWSNLILWVVLYIVILHEYLRNFLGDRFNLLNIAVVLFVMIVPIYVHNLVLIPKLLLKQKYVSYILSLLFLLVLTAYAFSFEDGDFREDLLKYLPFFIVAASINLIKRQILGEMEKRSVDLFQREMELNSLKAQINPHFLFNTLNNIYALTLTNSPQAPEVVLQLAGLMRYQLESTKKNLVTINEEIEFLKQYFELEKIRVGGKANLIFEVDLDKYSLWIPPMILMTFIENAFKHGVNRDKSKSYIKISISSQKQNLTMIIENGKPEQKSVNTGFGGFGLKNVERRLELLLPGKHEIRVEEDDEKYATIINLKL